MSLLTIHLFMLGNCATITSRLFLISYFVICFSKNPMGLLLRVFIKECH